MFNVLNKAPPIPETLSTEGKDFLQWCFQRRPEDRASANKLLKHPFLRSSQDQNFAGFVQEFSGMKLHVSFRTSRLNHACMNLIVISHCNAMFLSYSVP